MNRHLRNFLFFALAFTFTVLAGFASATGWTVNDGYDHSGGNLNRVPYGNATAGTAATAVVNGDNVDVTRSWSQPLKDAVTGATATAAINVLSKVPTVGIVNAAKSLTLPGLAMTVATTWLLNQNWEQQNGQWMMPSNTLYPYQYKTSSWSTACSNVYQAYSAAVSCFKQSIINSGRTVSGSESFSTSGGFTYIQINAQPTTYGYIKDVWTNNGQLAAKIASTDADLVSQMQNLVNAKAADVLRDLAKNNIELQGAKNQINQAAQALSAQKTTATGTKTNPDGSTEAYQMQEMIKFEIPSDLFNSDDPVPVKQSTITTTTTNVYNTDNTVKTTTTTDIKNSNVTVKPDPQTDCDKKPNSVGCADLGSAPPDPTVGTQTVNPTFSWSPFSLPATCPAPQTIATSRGSFTYSWQPACDFASMLRPLVIAFAGLAALYVAFGMKNDG